MEPCILAGCPKDGVVLDPFMGSGTVAYVAVQHGRRYLGCELNPEYIEIAKRRLVGIETGVPAKERTAGQMGLFDGERQ